MTVTLTLIPIFFFLQPKAKTQVEKQRISPAIPPPANVLPAAGTTGMAAMQDKDDYENDSENKEEMADCF